MTLPFLESKHISLRDAGYSEQWLQEKLHKDPSLLGLGDLKSLSREVRQSSKGRLDLLLTDPESEVMYEVEVMLGATDESHIIRTIEYWDIESRRWPSKEHRAVIVAESITNRFFNVVWLLSRSIPIIAVKLDAIEVNGNLVLSFTKVLDLYEAPESAETSGSSTTAQSWIDYSNKDSYDVFEKIIELLSSQGRSPKITYNADHIAVGGQRKNFAWFKPTKKNPHCIVEVRVGETNLESALAILTEAGLDASRYSSNAVRMRITASEVSAKSEAVKKVLEFAVIEGGGV